MLKIPRRGTPDPAELEWSRVMTYAEKLCASLEALDDAGGVCRVAALGRWPAERHDAALGRLLALVEAIEAEAGRLELRRRHFGARRGRLG